MEKANKKILYATLLTALALPFTALADASGILSQVLGLGGYCLTAGTVGNVIGVSLPAGTLVLCFVMNAMNTILYVASGLIVIMWVITGMLFLMASGSPEKLTSAKKALLWAVAGTVFIIVAKSAVTIVANSFGLQ